MANDRLEYCILNVAANPHPDGIYVQLLQDAAYEEVNYWGERSALITRPRPTSDDRELFVGHLVTWNEIDLEQPGVLRRKLREVDPADAEVDAAQYGSNMPPDLGFNSRLFYYVLRVSDHKIFVETRNERGIQISPNQVGRIFHFLLGKEPRPTSDEFVEITLIPDAEALNQIFGLARLRTLSITLVRQNADDESEAAQEVLAELDAEGARKKDIAYTAAPGGDGLTPIDRTKAQAAAGEMSGSVAGTGDDDDGQRQHYSTRNHPRLIRSSIADAGSALASIYAVARNTIVRSRRGEDL